MLRPHGVQVPSKAAAGQLAALSQSLADILAVSGGPGTRVHFKVERGVVVHPRLGYPVQKEIE